MILEVEQIRLGYDDTPVVHDLSFSLGAGEVGCLLGASGCGKTTALRAIAGFERLLAGTIRVRGRLVSAPEVSLPPEKRGVGMVFQDHALFPHLTVADNVGFGLSKQSSRQRRRHVQDLLAMVGLKGLDQRFPHELSGGQQQRVAIARALAPEPAVMLLDEPFSNLDTGLRRQMGDEIRTLLCDRGTATVLVTHDQQEAFALADWVGLMRAGRLLQWDTPYQLYHRPRDRYVAGFTGRGSYLSARVTADGMVHALGRSPVGADKQGIGEELDLLIRPDDIRPATDGRPSRVLERHFLGAEIFYRLRLENGEEVGALFPSHENHAVDDIIGIRLDAKHLITFSRV